MHTLAITEPSLANAHSCRTVTPALAEPDSKTGSAVSSWAPLRNSPFPHPGLAVAGSRRPFPWNDRANPRSVWRPGARRLLAEGCGRRLQRRRTEPGRRSQPHVYRDVPSNGVASVHRSGTVRGRLLL